MGAIKERLSRGRSLREKGGRKEGDESVVLMEFKGYLRDFQLKKDGTPPFIFICLHFVKETEDTADRKSVV